MASKKNIERAQVEILIVEDSTTQAERLRYLLASNDYQVVVARNGQEALELARRRTPSVIVTDVVMPGMSGYDLCRVIKSDTLLQSVPVVLLTSLSGPDDIFRGLECGADNFIRKPYEEDYLLARIDGVLAHLSLRSTENLQLGVEITLGDQRHFITAQRQQILDLLISTSEEAMRLNEGLKRTNLTLRGLYKTVDGLNRARSETDVCSVALDQAMELTGVKSGWVYLRNGGDEFRVAASRSLPEALQAPGKLDGTCACRQLCLSGELDRAVRITNCVRLAGTGSAEEAIGCHVSVPLWIDQEAGGIMVLYDNEQTSFSDEELQTLSVLGAQIGTALERTHLRDNLARLVLERTFELTQEIEERKKVQESQERLTAILESTTDLVSIAKPGGPLLYLNRGGRRLLELPETEDALARGVPDFHPEWAQSQLIEEGFPTALRDGSWSGETALLTRQGKEIPVSEVILAHPGRHGESVLFSTTARDITESRLAKEKIQTQLDRLRALRSIDMAITDGLNLHIALDVLLTAVTDLLRVDAASVLVLNQDQQLLEPAAERGFRLNSIKWSVPFGQGTSGRAALERRTIECADLAAEPDFTRASLFKDEDFVAHFAVPLIAHDHVNGVLEIFHRGRLDPDAEWLDYLQALAGQAAIAVDVALLFEGLQRSNAELTMAYDATILGWWLAMDLRDKETEGHTQRVTEISVALARKMGFSEPELVHVRRGALLHDIGKMGVPDSVLLKPGALTDEEWVLMRRHPEHAYEMLLPIEFLKASLDIPYCHHEKWDGSGYPRGLKGKEIPLAARLFAVVDVWDALRSDRPYRRALSEETVLDHLRKGSGTHFDPDVVTAFLTLIADEGVSPAQGS